MSGALDASKPVRVQTRAGGSLTVRPGRGCQEPGAWLIRPDTVDPTLPPLVAVHGIHRRADDQARFFAERAIAQGRVVIAPLFDGEYFERYQKAVERDRADLALLRLLGTIGDEGVADTSRIELFGYSGGAQFAHRFAWVYPHRIAKLSLAAAGWYTFPDRAPFPYGLGPAKRRRLAFGGYLEANLGDFLRLPITVTVGTEDDVIDPNTRSGDEIDTQQGSTRRRRAARWVEALRQRAREMGVPHRTVLHLLEGCGHDFRQCMRVGALDRIVLPDAQDGDRAADVETERNAPAVCGVLPVPSTPTHQTRKA